MWGQVPFSAVIPYVIRIIPMRVGTRRCSASLLRLAGDHPHACGDKLSFLSSSGTYTGSSPCVWGQEDSFHTTFTKLWIIPMRVGTRSRVTVLRVRPQDHPHACGDKVSDMRRSQTAHGSSPCVWGQVALPSVSAVLSGIIPMRVGTSLHPLLFQRQT